MLGRPTLTHSLSNSLEACVIDAANPVVVRQHMLCAAAEQPLGGQLVDDALLFGGQQAFDEAVRALCAVFAIDSSVFEGTQPVHVQSPPMRAWVGVSGQWEGSEVRPVSGPRSESTLGSVSGFGARVG